MSNLANRLAATKLALVKLLIGSLCRRKRLTVMVLGILAAFFCQGPSNAVINADLVDDYLESQFDWAMFIEKQEVKHYLNYEGSKLRPLTRVRIYFRVFSHSGDKPPGKNPAKIYEDLWYSNGSLLGLRRLNRLKIEKDQNGIIIIGKGISGSAQALAVSNALVRLALDLQFQRIIASLVQVPAESYDQIAGNLAHYKFFKGTEPIEGKQMSIHLRSSTEDREDYYYLH